MRKTDAPEPSRYVKKSGAHRLSLMLVVSLAIILVGCNVVNDSKLKQNFFKHRAGFKELQDMIAADPSLLNVGPTSPPQASGGISQHDWDEYKDLLQGLGLKGGVGRRQGLQGATFFYVECYGSAISRDCKGYVHSEKTLSPLEGNLDGPAPGIHFESLSGSWYIFRDGD